MENKTLQYNADETLFYKAKVDMRFPLLYVKNLYSVFPWWEIQGRYKEPVTKESSMPLLKKIIRPLA